MIARIVVQASLFVFSCAVRPHMMRDESLLHQGAGTEAVIVTHNTVGAIPLAVNVAIRKLNGQVSRKLTLSLRKALEAQMEAVKAKETAAEQAKQKRNATLEAVAFHNAEFSRHAERARCCGVRRPAEQWKALDASVSEATEALNESKAEVEKVIEEKNQEQCGEASTGWLATAAIWNRGIGELRKMQMALDEKKAKRDEAENVLKEKEVALQKAGEFKQTKAGPSRCRCLKARAKEHDEAEAEMHKARQALEKNQMLLDQAADALAVATAQEKEAKEQAKILEEEHGKQKKGLEMLRTIRSSILAFYEKLDKLTASMENQMAENPDALAAQMLRKDPHLKATFEGYNEMVEGFYKLDEADAEMYGGSASDR
eukprot:Skav229169  [mRNA]  locus=scaffold1381:358338:363365:+ [translate_table: standard]